MQIFILQNNEQTGPFTLEELQQHVNAGTLPPETPAWREGLASWVTLGEIVRAPEAPPAYTPPPPPMAAEAPAGVAKSRGSGGMLIWAVGGVAALVAAGVIGYFVLPSHGSQPSGGAPGPAATSGLASLLPSAYPALDEKNGFRDYKFGTAINQFSTDNVFTSDMMDGRTKYTLRDFDKKLGNAEISNIALIFDHDMLEEIEVSVGSEDDFAAMQQTLITAYGQPKIDPNTNAMIWAGKHVHLMLERALMGFTARFTSPDVEAQIQAQIQRNAKDGAAQGAKDL